jgi:hypothetical protein
LGTRTSLTSVAASAAAPGLRLAIFGGAAQAIGAPATTIEGIRTAATDTARIKWLKRQSNMSWILSALRT